MDNTLELETKPLARALVSYAVKSIDPASADRAPKSHFEWLQAGVIQAACDITDTALRLLGRSSIASSDPLPQDAAIVIGYSLLLMLGITQAVSKEGIKLDANELAERLIAKQLAARIKAAGNDEAAKREILEISRVAAQIPGQVVETAKGEVEELFKTCYAVLPDLIQNGDEATRQLMPIFGTALLVLLESQITTND